MDATELSFGIVNVLQISNGISVNVFLLLFYIHMASTSHRPSFSDQILTQLAFANIIILLSRGIPDTVSALGLRNFLDDVRCKILLTSPSAPEPSGGQKTKPKLPKCIIPLCILSWVLNILTYVTGPQNSSSVRITLALMYCSNVSASAGINLVIAVIFPLRDLFFMELMSVASGYIVFALYRHHHQVQHLHGPGRCHRVMPEIRVAKRVIALVTLYALLYR
ncbi:vomeronasal type-1 receptor 3-like [Tachyglossus aculeatus]|uniref:vomeronasal type-1 receptor 3-like n=1 Tax=Tachyglossus aculeatus TaxID=9261 RepID=UPI0018F310A4|nr:vomeronasal type-1 receptor 3-like [Tachyglossus aculeatus]